MAADKNLTETNDGEQAKDGFFADDCAAKVLMAGHSNSIRNTIRMIKIVAASRCNPILIVGKSGTGKELVAKAVHNLRCPDKKFIAINCAALTTNLLESELFGHVKGSFTGADRDKTGLLELAETGTVFLDEISEMPLNLQAKLLRVVQERNFRKVGGTRDIQCAATIMASSNRNLHKEAAQNRFRADLYYRLNVCPITLSPLSSPQRRSDIRLLSEYFLKTSTICPEKTGKVTSMTNMALGSLEKYHWPGNVRELKNVIDRAILMETTDKIGLSSIIINPFELCELPQESAVSPAVSNFSLEKAERELIAGALKQTGGQKTKAASLLGITRATLYAKVKQYNISEVKQDSYTNTMAAV